MNRKMKTTMVTACLGLATALIGYDNLTQEVHGKLLTDTGRGMGGFASDVSSNIHLSPDEYQSLKLGMTETEVARIHYKLLNYKVENSSITIPDGVEVYESQFKRQIVMNPEETSDVDGVPVYFKMTWAFEINDAGEQNLIAKRIDANSAAMNSDSAGLECFPSNSFLCEGNG
ncbi:MAG: hypothetical protein F6K11_04335 [Leptolyngbya sp. SIO3F4]|nr:hypothetical protein [Leptolyngbya sp. SIO3F4]